MSQIFPVYISWVGNSAYFKSVPVELKKIYISFSLLKNKFTIMLILKTDESFTNKIGDIEQNTVITCILLV